MKNSIAILYICTGKYNVLWHEFYESFESYFLLDCSKHYYVFTDADIIEYEENNTNIHRIYQEPLKWPYATLLRFHMFNRMTDQLSNFDYVFFFNANACAIKSITKEMILPRIDHGEEIVVVKHPAYRYSNPYDFPYDRNFKCKAYIPFGKGEYYVQGCLIGGTSHAFLEMSKVIANQIDYDLSHKTIALWHDESYLNKYILKYKHYRLLSIDFANPISSNPHIATIHMRPKDLYFCVEAIKEDTPTTKLLWINSFINTIAYRFLSHKAIFLYDYRTMKQLSGRKRALVWGLKNFWRLFPRRERTDHA